LATFHGNISVLQSLHLAVKKLDISPFVIYVPSSPIKNVDKADNSENSLSIPDKSREIASNVAIFGKIPEDLDGKY
jgi:hypothetical protein